MDAEETLLQSAESYFSLGSMPVKRDASLNGTHKTQISP